jgi:outer membrane protein OmpA-like peptidoglycan-associated protein
MKKYLMSLAFAGMSIVAFAQHDSEETRDGSAAPQTSNKYQVFTNKFWHNWFISAGGGASVMFGEADRKADFDDRISPTFHVAMGKWFTPGLGLRLQYSGLQAKGASLYTGGNYADAASVGGIHAQKFNYMNLHGDALLNLSTLFFGYNEKRVYEFIPYLGAGWVHNYSAPHRNSVGLNAGLVNRFRVGKAIDINLELSGLFVEDKFDGEVGGDHSHDGVASVTLGLTYRFPGRTFSKAQPAAMPTSELNELRDRIARMAAERDQMSRDLQQALTAAHKQPEKEVVEKVVVKEAPAEKMGPVFFGIGSAVISSESATHLAYMAGQMKQSGNSYVVKGYADSSTGTPEYNRQLSLKRAQAVVNALVKKYGVDASKVTAEGEGGVDSFGSAKLNRMVIIEVAK